MPLPVRSAATTLGDDVEGRRLVRRLEGPVAVAEEHGDGQTR